MSKAMCKLLRSRFHRPVRTARCVLVDGERHLLVVHAGKGRHRHACWGFPGGHVNVGEAPEAAARRELREELYLSVGKLTFVDDYFYKGGWHRVFAAPWQAPIPAFDNAELLKIGWFSAAQAQALADSKSLHAGYEHEVIRRLGSRLSEQLQVTG